MESKPTPNNNKTTKNPRLPLCNVYAKGDFTAELYLGSHQQLTRVIIDSGSSSLVVKETHYQPENDQSLQATTLAQDVTYGLGGWDGPVIKSEVLMKGVNIDLKDKGIEFAVAVNLQQDTFGKADGILGMAYHRLNKSYDLSEYLKQQDNDELETRSTFPWPFEQNTTTQTVKSFKQFLWQYPEQDITPFFTQLELEELCANRFSFHVVRSSIHWSATAQNDQHLIDDPLNRGLLILGGGEEETDLYDGDFNTLKVLHDVYYNVNLLGIQLDGGDYITAPPLDEKHQTTYFTNGIIDTGAGAIVLPASLYQALLKSFEKMNPNYRELIESVPPFKGEETGIDADKINIDQWPTLNFLFEGYGEEPIRIACPASNYWQINAPQHNQIAFKIFSQISGWPDQSILGLPLLANHYVIFDRDYQQNGAIHLAKSKNVLGKI